MSFICFKIFTQKKKTQPIISNYVYVERCFVVSIYHLHSKYIKETSQYHPIFNF